MPDITKCRGKGCLQRASCWRYTSEADPIYQSFFKTSPCTKDGRACVEYWKDKRVAPAPPKLKGEYYAQGYFCEECGDRIRGLTRCEQLRQLDGSTLYLHRRCLADYRGRVLNAQIR